MPDNLLNMTNEEVVQWFRKEISDGLYDPEFIRRLDEYNRKIKNDFKIEWAKKKFKWFFTKYRQKKLRVKIIRRYSGPMFLIIEDMIEEMLPKAMDDFFDKFIDIKDVSLGDKNYFTEENNNV